MKSHGLEIGVLTLLVVAGEAFIEWALSVDVGVPVVVLVIVFVWEGERTVRRAGCAFSAQKQRSMMKYCMKDDLDQT